MTLAGNHDALSPIRSVSATGRGADERPSDTRLGPYEIAAKLGEGGMGVVFRANDLHLGRQLG